MNKKILNLLLAVVIMFGMSTPSYADSNFNITDSTTLEYEILKINYDGNDKELFIQFKDREHALNYVKINYSELFKIIEKDYKLKPISMYNWKEYYEVLGILDQMNTEFTKKYYNEIVELNKFFDVFENTDKNITILKLSNEGKSFKNNAQQLELLLPNKSNIHKMENETRETVDINLDDAVDYAETHATSPNKNDYDYFSVGDCTNFVSQILEAGGVQQEVYNSEYKGWWHKKEEGWIWDSHEHSVSFIRASTFANYMGISYSTQNHKNFSSELTKGDIIGFDKTGDGDWDHMAFVTDKKTNIKNYSGKKYYNYKVAQHTSNYLEWTSSDDNGWETLEDKGYTYGIIRR